MKKVLWLTLNILRVSLRKRSTVVSFFFLPIFGMLLTMGVYSGQGASPSRIGVVDQDRSALSGNLVDSLRGGDRFTLSREADRREMEDKLIAGKLDCGMVIPAGFEAAIKEARPKKIDLVSVKGEAATAWIENDLGILLANLRDIGAAAGGDEGAFRRIYAGYQQAGQELAVNEVKDEGLAKDVTSGSLGFLILFMMMGVGNACEIILREKRTRTFYRICAAPVSARSYIFGNIFANLILITGQAILAILVMTKVFGMAASIPGIQLFAILMMFGLATVGLGVLIVAIARDNSQAGVLQMLIVLPSCFLAGCFFPVSGMPRIMQRIADFFPQKWAMDAIQRLQDGRGFANVLPDLGIILAFAAALFLIAAYRFGRNDETKTFV